MTKFEYAYRILRYFEHPLYQRVYRLLRKYSQKSGPTPLILDVGGRRSNYTIGVKGRILITDIPRETETQNTLDLGATDSIIKTVLSRRSNIEKYVIDDMTKTIIEPGSIDIVVAIEVLEHVSEDDLFVKNVRKILKDKGSFIMTTPNGDEIPDPYPDHKRHYRRNELKELLEKYFHNVEVGYCVEDNLLFKIGLFRWSIRSPVRTVGSMLANFLNYRWERIRGNEDSSTRRQQHLFAVCSGVIN
ncbi:methyltransferase domain-containing protein [Thioalkalivibrio sulfidiphilus]|uniref:methyltransferase domain-containing protein n=1 Tax=Thioalkalivibrio sulfidiphilus TaxID=1033854 RepID=UPI000368C3E3|nr:methyltransferase domain-containing protein [Thioalkalivibrio sulfidiphilus]